MIEKGDGEVDAVLKTYGAGVPRKRVRRLERFLASCAKNKYLLIIIAPVIIYFAVFYYGPMYGVIIAFKDYRILDGIMGSPWIGFDNFRDLLSRPGFLPVFKNTVIISLLRIIFGTPAPIIFALLLNEIYNLKFKKIVQSISYLPYFMSWVVLSGMIINLLSPSRGLLTFTGIDFLTDPGFFRGTLITTGIWQSIGWNSIIYLAAIVGIDPALYECAYLEGAKRFQLMRYITIPLIMPVISILFILSLTGILSAGFDQIFNMYNPLVMDVSDVLDTYVYRMGLQNMDYSYATTVGLFQNVIGGIMVLSVNFILAKTGQKEYTIW